MKSFWSTLNSFQDGFTPAGRRRNKPEPRLFGNSGVDGYPADRFWPCDCLHRDPDEPSVPHVGFHPERQDTDAPGWRHLLQLIRKASADGREEFQPFAQMSRSERDQIVTLPAEIASLTEVRRLCLYGSSLVRLPPAVAHMRNLEYLDLYTSYGLHWLPYELTRCSKLKDSRISTRALYGNNHHRPPFPALDPDPIPVAGLGMSNLDPVRFGAKQVRECSVCREAIAVTLHQAWITLWIGTDEVPLLVNACSEACIHSLPAPPPDNIAHPHHGGDIAQPQPVGFWRLALDADSKPPPP